MNQMNGVCCDFLSKLIIFIYHQCLGIELVSDSVEVPNENTVDRSHIELASSSSGTISLDQVKYQYVPKVKCNPQIDTSDNETSAASTARDEDLSIEDLMAQMKRM